MAISTIGSYFMHGTGTGTLTWAELFKFKTDPTLQDPPEVLDTTDQTCHARTSIFGLAANDSKAFTCNYDPTTYDTIKGLEGHELNLSEWLGDTFDSSTNTYTPDGHYGKFTGKGYLTVTLNGGDVNAVRDMTVTLAVTVPFVKESA
jgi:hypothetical protein